VRSLILNVPAVAGACVLDGNDASQTFHSFRKRTRHIEDEAAHNCPAANLSPTSVDVIHDTVLGWFWMLKVGCYPLETEACGRLCSLFWFALSHSVWWLLMVVVDGVNEAGSLDTASMWICG
jgi:hypothetical protein